MGTGKNTCLIFEITVHAYLNKRRSFQMEKEVMKEEFQSTKTEKSHFKDIFEEYNILKNRSWMK